MPRVLHWYHRLQRFYCGTQCNGHHGTMWDDSAASDFGSNPCDVALLVAAVPGTTSPSLTASIAIPTWRWLGQRDL